MKQVLRFVAFRRRDALGARASRPHEALQHTQNYELTKMNFK